MSLPVPIIYFPLDAASGNETDVIGGVTATAINTPGSTAGLDGTVRTFLRSSQESFEVPDSDDYSFVGESFSLSIWAKFDSFVTSGNYEGLITKFSTASSNREWGLYYEGTTSKLRFTLTNSGSTTDVGGILDLSIALSTGVWYHITAVYDHAAGQMRIHVNGGTPETKSYALGGTNRGAKLCIGRLDNLSSWMDGQLAHAAIFGEALTTAQALELATTPAITFPNTMLTDCGISGVTTTSAKYRLKASYASPISIEYSVNSDLSDSTIGGDSSTALVDNNTGGGEITGLTADTTYYYSFLSNGTRQHSEPFPYFKTMPNRGMARICFSSCQDDPDEATIFAAIADENPDLFIHLGDFGYPDSTVLADQRTNYQTQLDGNYRDDLQRKVACERIWDDHDYGTNNSTGDISGKENSLQAFKEYSAYYDLATGTASGTLGIWRNFTIGHAEIFLLDVRYQREGTKVRFPTASTNTADTGSTGATLVLRAADSPSGTDDFYNGWYVLVEGVYRRVTDYVGATRTATLSASVTGLDDASTYFLKLASMLDQDNIGANNQLDWLIDGMNNTSARWAVMASPVMWHPSITNNARWGDWDSEEMERNYILQQVTNPDKFVISADAHWSAIDDGTNAGWPEITASPLNQTNLNEEATWTNGRANEGHYYGLVEITANEVRLMAKGGGVEDLVPLILTHSDPVDSYPLLNALRGARL